ncbi:MAG: TIGR02444 family protein [SAR86 cluster bacterium]|uniref:TIGR02444 family protein n=1 Tax=SAR86 cluster bacterium TaxID=2030880 RepID=A0A2A4X1B1_9GAMM|nr:MAG: TIGR02444 family protein [SAR86 cluster bacterium]
MPNEPQKFWNFSLELYNREGVAAACLELQDAYQLDVNLILFCFWHGKAYGEVDKELLQSVIELSIEWRSHVVQPLRSARAWMKLNPSPSVHFDSLRERIKADELMAEKYQQEQIASLTSAFNRGRQCVFGNDDIGKNIDSLLHAAEIEQDGKITSRLEIIRGAIEE